MKEFRASIRIRESPDAIYPYLLEPALVVRWAPGLISSQVVQGTITDAGSVLRSTYRMSGREFEAETRVVDLELPRAIVTQETMKGVTMVQRVELSPQGEETLVELHVRLTEMSLSRRLVIALMPTLLQSQSKTALGRLKLAVEDPNRKLERADKLPLGPQIPLFIVCSLAGVVIYYILTGLF